MIRRSCAVALLVVSACSGSTGPEGPPGPKGDPGQQGLEGPRGETGPSGPQGNPGPQGLVWRGSWSGATTYGINDAVEHRGAAYVAVAPSTAIAPPSIEWSLVAAQGATGPAGPQGPAGAEGSVGPTGPQGPSGPAGPSGAVTFGTTAGTAAEGNDPRLSDARAPIAGSPLYIQNGTAPQAASLAVTGSGAFGGTVAAAQFSGSGAALTSVPASSLTGKLPDAALSTNVVLRSDPFRFPTSSSAPSSPTDGQAYFDTTTATLQVYDGATWRTLAWEQGFGLRSVSSSALSPGAALTVTGNTRAPVVTVWLLAGAQWSDVTGNPSFPVSFAGGAVTVTNGSGATVALTIVVAGQ